MGFEDSAVHIWGENSHRGRLRICGPRGGDGASAVLTATAGAADRELIGFVGRRFVAGMHRFTTAAGMLRRSGGRQRERKEASDNREKQQKSGGHAMHDLSVKQNPEWCQHRTELRGAQDEG